MWQEYITLMQELFSAEDSWESIDTLKYDYYFYRATSAIHLKAGLARPEYIDKGSTHTSISAYNILGRTGNSEQPRDEQ